MYRASVRSYSNPTRFVSTSQANLHPFTVSGLLAAWLADESSGALVDSVGSYTSSSVTGTTVVAGKLNNARSFGSGDIIQFSSSPFSSGGARSVCFWINVPVLQSSSYSRMMRFAAPSGQWNVNISHTSAANKQASMGFHGGTQYWYPFTAVAATWQHLVYMYNGGASNSASSYSFYLNGVSVSSGGSDGAISDPTTVNQIGQNGSGVAQYLGIMDSILVFNKALSQAEITRIYNSTYNAVSGNNLVLYP